VWVLVLASAAVGARGLVAEGAQKPAEPFYRKYLVPGNRLDDRILEQERRIEASPNDASLRNDFGNLLAERRFPDQAAEQYEMAAKLDESNFIALYNLGLLRETEGKVSKALDAYKKSIGRKPGFPQAHFRLGRLYERTGRNEDAVREFAQALWIDRSMRDPRRNPLVVDSELIYRASLANYSRDVASASMARESVYVEESRFRAMPVDRPLSSQEASGEDESEVNLEPRQIGPADAAGSATEGSAGAAKRTGAPNPMTGRPRPAPRKTPRGGSSAVVPPGTPPPAAPPSVDVAPGAPEPETPPESMPEPTPSAPLEEEPS
jgi:hypothetical protein